MSAITIFVTAASYHHHLPNQINLVHVRERERRRTKEESDFFKRKGIKLEEENEAGEISRKRRLVCLLLQASTPLAYTEKKIMMKIKKRREKEKKRDGNLLQKKWPVRPGSMSPHEPAVNSSPASAPPRPAKEKPSLSTCARRGPCVCAPCAPSLGAAGAAAPSALHRIPHVTLLLSNLPTDPSSTLLDLLHYGPSAIPIS